MKIETLRSKIHVFAPASVANVGSGFDVFGFALDAPGDEIILKITAKPGVVISKITGDSGKLPTASKHNTAGAALISMLDTINAPFGVDIVLKKKMPIGSGLGSSAASAVAGIYALNCLLAQPLENQELLRFAIEGEKITCGERVHLDNIAACLYGGFIMVRSRELRDIISLPLPDELYYMVVHPHIEIKTSDARQLLKKQIPLTTAITQWGNIAGVVSALYRSDYELLSRSMQDNIAEPVRSMLIPFYDEMRNLALQNDVLGFNIAGSGPSVFVLARGKSKLYKLGKKIQSLLKTGGIGCEIYISQINRQGPRVIS